MNVLRYFIPLTLMVIGSQFNAIVAADEPIKLQLSWKHQFEFAGYYAAKHLGYYEQLGREVVITEYQAGMDVIKEVTSNRSEFATVSSSFTHAFLEGKPIKLLANVFKRSALVLLSHTESGIHEPSDIQGKRLMLTIQERSSAEFLTFFMRNGIDLADVTFIEHSFDPLVMGTGEVDVMSGYITNQPFLLKQAGIPFTVLDLSKHGIDFYGDGLIASTLLCESDPDLVRYFRDVSLVGWYYALANPEEMVDLIIAEYSSEKSREALLYEAEETIRLIDTESFLLGSIDPERIEKIASGLVEAGVISSADGIGNLIFDSAGPIDINTKDQSEMELNSPKEEPDAKLTVVSILLITVALVVLVYSIYKLSRMAKIRARLKEIANREDYTATILAVDDAPAILVTLTELLKEKYHVKVAPNGDIALKIAQAHDPPDLILLDVVMPGKSGFDVARELQSNEGTRDIPIIFVTGRTDEESISEGYRVGGVDYVPKPFNPDELLARVETHLQLRNAKEQVEDMSSTHDE